MRACLYTSVAYVEFTVYFCAHIHTCFAIMKWCARVCVMPCVCLCTCSMGVSEHECICMHINVGCVSAEFLTQTGHEKGTLDCCLSTAVATRPAATRLTAN